MPCATSNAHKNTAPRAFRYQKASPRLFLWGMIWMTGYAANYFAPRVWQLWPVLVATGIVGSIWIGRRPATKQPSSAFAWRYTATLLAGFLSVAALLAILPAASSAQIDALFPLMASRKLWVIESVV